MRYSIDRGRWLSSVNYWIFPKEEEPEVLKRLVPFKKPARPDITLYSDDFSKILHVGTATTEEIEKYEETLKILRNEIYNSQVLWRLRDLHLSVDEDFNELIAEFLNLSAEAVRKFDWLHSLSSGVRWREHGWKHISYQAIADYWESYRTGFLASLKAELICNRDEVRALISAATKNDPEAVGKIWALFPTSDQRWDLLLTALGPDEGDWPTIPDPADIAAQLVRSIYESPESEKAEESRRTLRRLISLSVTKGEKGERGRPKAKVPAVVLRRLWRMSYCEVTQVREVSKFLEGRKIPRETRSSTLLALYPWIRKMVGENLNDFVSLEPNKAALLMVGRLTGVGPSTLEKMGLRSRE